MGFIISKELNVKVRSKRSPKKLLRQMSQWSFGTQNLTRAFSIGSDMREGHGEFKQDQISKFLFSCKNTPILSCFVAGFQKRHLFRVRRLERPKAAFQKETSSLLPLFYHCTAKNIGWRFCMLVGGVYLYNIYSVFYKFKEFGLCRQ